MKNNLHRDVELLYEVGSLRHIQRTWRQHFGIDVANDLEHTLRVQYIALILSRMEGQGDHEIIMKMALMHDLAEARTGDQNFLQKRYGKQEEIKALHDSLAGTHLEEEEALIQRYLKRECIESKIVKDADHLDVDVELAELAYQGHKLPVRWLPQRKQTRDTKFFTKSAQKLWDAIQTSDPHSWHLT